MVCSNSKITNIDIYIFLSESRHYNLFHMSSESRHYNLFHKYHFMLFFLGTTFVEDNLSITTLVGCHSVAFFFMGQLLHWATFSEQLSWSVILCSSFHCLTFVNCQFALLFLQCYFFGGQLSWFANWRCSFAAQLSQLVNFMVPF